jgi:DNA-binding transcriptional LysR family regulator
MKTGPDWKDLAYFAAIARTGGLAKAAQETGVSVATLSRRMKAFETSLGRRLFLHGADGYVLTSDGQALAEKMRLMEEAAQQITKWHTASEGPACVRISAGTWTAFDLAERLPTFWSASDAWVPEFLYSDTDLDIARREVDIGIRNRMPDQPWLARQQIGTVEYAVYGADETVSGWIGPAWKATLVPSSEWIKQNHGNDIVTKANSPHLAAALARAGIGRVVLPTFTGRRIAGLMSLSDPIAELGHAQWLVSHHDARKEPPIRAALDAIGDYLTRRDQV